MAIYEYKCEICGSEKELRRSVERRDAPALCGICGSFLKRKVSDTAPPNFKGDGWTQKVYD